MRGGAHVPAGVPAATDADRVRRVFRGSGVARLGLGPPPPPLRLRRALDDIPPRHRPRRRGRPRRRRRLVYPRRSAPHQLVPSDKARWPHAAGTHPAHGEQLALLPVALGHRVGCLPRRDGRRVRGPRVPRARGAGRLPHRLDRLPAGRERRAVQGDARGRGPVVHARRHHCVRVGRGERLPLDLRRHTDAHRRLVPDADVPRGLWWGARPRRRPHARIDQVGPPRRRLRAAPSVPLD
mmetsp:Transcript_1670/g.5011  ORF Transcript_1670/g.5011 Transcript_1670/m.5011 type:complete len:238 (-) Transcript_1670:1158-1871(-)